MAGVQGGVDELLHRQHAHEDNTILDWLTPIDYAPQQSGFIARRQEGTGKWFLDSKQFKEWLNQAKKTLFCPGIPGAGKTIITSIVVQHLCTKFRSDSTVGVAYVYCNFRPLYQQKPIDLLSSLLKQFIQKRPTVPEHIKTLYANHRIGRTRPLLSEVLEALKSVLSDYSQAFIILDALDELRVSDGRQTLLLEIFKLQSVTRVNLLATSRIDNQIKSLFDGALSLQIHATAEDIGIYVDEQMLLLQPDILDGDSQDSNDDIRAMIRRGVVRAVDGMFLLAELHMKTLVGLPTRGHIKEAVQNMAKGVDGLDKVYEQAMERIKNQGTSSQELARSILAWIVHARRPLSVLEFRHALAVKPCTGKLDEDYLPSIRVVRSLCAGLVTVDKESNIIRLVHYTTQEYFERTQMLWFPNAHRDIARTCVTYMSFDTFETGPCPTDKEFEERLHVHVLYDYAARNWGHHARMASASIEEEQLTLSFLESEAKVSSSSQVLMVPIASRYLRHSQRAPRQVTALHLAAYFGLSKATTTLFKNKHNPDVQDSRGRTPLSWAAESGHETVVGLLLAKDGVDVNSKDLKGRTPLSWAVREGQEAVVKLLLAKNGVDVNSKDSQWGQTPL
ncbi:ankyrin repeat protein, partial [Glonium stellatum]